MSALSDAIQAINDYTAGGDERSQIVAAKCRALMHGYDAKYYEEPYTTILTEKFLTARLVNTETGRQARKFQMAGKIDVLAEREGRRVLIDHKTTSSDLSFDSDYWKHLRIDKQSTHYMILLMDNGIQVDDVVWDVVRKPTIKQRQNDTLADYEKRLMEDVLDTRPDFYLARRVVVRLESEILRYAEEAWRHSKDILEDVRRWETGKIIPQTNDTACFDYHKTCKFLDLCTGCDTVNSGNWEKKPVLHPELPDAPDDEKKLLTQSRVKCYQSCRRRHHYEYVEGIRRVKEREDDALYFGNVLHKALEKWWDWFKE